MSVILQLKQKYGRFKSLLLLILVMGFMAYVGFWIGNKDSIIQQAQIDAQNERLENLYQETEKQLKQINFLAVELEIEKLASEQSQTSLARLQKKIYDMRTELTFYQKVMAPELMADGLAIDSFSIVETETKGRFKFKLVIIQSDKTKRYAKGHILLSIDGKENEQAKEYDLLGLAKLSKKQAKFSFQYFQVFEEEFDLPSGFSPEQIKTSVVLPKGKWQEYKRVDRSFEWAKIAATKGDSETAIILE